MKLTKLISSVVLFVCSFWALIAAASPSWTLLGPGGLTFPLFRGGSTTVYDPSSNRVILFAGSSDDVGNPRLNDVWVQTNANGLGGTGAWSQLLPSGALPQVRSQHSAVYDAANNRMIIYGGCGAVPTSNGCLPIADNVWVLSNANGLGGTPTWTQLFPTGGPPPARQSHQAVYDPGTNSMIVWAGQNGGGSACATFPDVWVLSHANGLGGTPNWTQLSTTGGPPPGQYSSTAVYDSTNNVLTVFGGTGLLGTHCGLTDAVWALSHANGTGGTPVWTNLVPQGAPGAPSNRSATFGIYEPDTNTMTIFGGSARNGAVNDTWVLSHANGIGGSSAWTRLSIPGPIPVQATRWNNGGFDSVNDRMIMFGGSFSEGPLWSTWVLTDPSGQ
ncbi:MAG: hypothetical protein DME59_00505 [Verrucomicrobia bacterium]|nr:MAG: hypothetical protein DME59_00505 [Verrucomicrobiota bacterium]